MVERAPRDLVIVAESDAAQMPLLRGMIGSARALRGFEEVAIRVMDNGLTEADRAWLSANGAAAMRTGTHFGIRAEAVPGYRLYLHADGDLWFQGRDCVGAFLRGAERDGLAVARERRRDYRFQAWLQAWTAKHLLLGLGPLDGAWVYASTLVNAGIHCLRADAPHWAAWQHHYAEAVRRTGAAAPYDQFALDGVTAGGLLGQGRLPASNLGATHNWIVDRRPPMWNDEANAFCVPHPPYGPLGALHLAGPAKDRDYEVRRTGGGSFRARLTWGIRPPGVAASSSRGWNMVIPSCRS